MKSIFRVLAAVALTTAATGCEKFLDINTNPNQAVEVNPDAQLSSALAVTAFNYHGGAPNGTDYNTYASFASGFWGKSGTVSGFAPERLYTYSTTYYQALFNNTYDNLNDYNLIQVNGAAKGYPNHAAIARIMKVYNFLLLVDEYGDIPYSQALKGVANPSPSYDKAEDIYRDFIVQLKGAVTDINAATAGRAVGNEDVVFRGNMTNWKRFANSLRLRILLRMSSTGDATRDNYVRTEMTALQTAAAAADGFITTDVLVQPGYAPNNNQQNPFYNRYGFAPGAVNATSEYSFVMPTNYIIRQYEVQNDPRIVQLYRLGKRTVGGVATNAYVGTDLGEGSPPTFTSTNATVGSRFLQGGTFLRGANQPTVLMLLAEHLFSKAEAETRGLFTGGDVAAKQDFLDGIKASFMHTFRDATTTPVTIAASTSTTPGVAQYNTYITANVGNALVDYDALTTTVREGTDPSTTPNTPLTTPRAVSKQEKILYQKYLAENTVASTEAWADFRRTGLPRFKKSVAVAANFQLPSRLFYPQTEISTNFANLKASNGGNGQSVNQFSKLFWDVID